MTDSTTRPSRTSRLDSGSFTAAEIQTMARLVGMSVDKVRRLTECSVLIAKLDRAEAAAPDAGLREALERMVNQWAPDATNPALDNARAALAAHRSSGCTCETRDHWSGWHAKDCPVAAGPAVEDE